MAVESDADRAAFVNPDEFGTTVTIKRYSGTGASRSSVTQSAPACVFGYEAAELIGNVHEGDSRVFVPIEELTGGAVALPLRRNDKVVVDGRELNVESVDERTGAYQLRVRG